MSLHKEIKLEDEICAYLASHDWLYAEKDEPNSYNREKAIYWPDLIDWLKATQTDAYEALTASGGAAAIAGIVDRVRKQIDARGTLDVLRYGVDMVGAGARLKLAEFKPALASNAEIVARYEANRLRVARQVHYSIANENSIDLVLFLNGIPVATVELKSDFTQSVGDAIDQYRFDRHPSPPRQRREPLLTFASGALVHFAVSNTEVYMTTKLEGKDTFFLPFNRGRDGGAGNPSDRPGHLTAYLWEDVWQRDSWLEIFGRYIIAEKDKKNKIEKLIFPRFHQLDATRKLVASVLSEGAGQKYLIQHSAGSGKTNSIAWSAHFLADLHDANERKVFNTIIVVSDRKVIDGQLQGAIESFERNKGVVATIKGEGGSKSGELAEALVTGKKIIVCTIQTFPFALEHVRELAASEGKTFAVIADEAHSSQTGTAAAKLREALSQEELDALADGGEVSTEDLLAAQMRARANEAGITFVAFTATPKAKTVELFGRLPNPNLPAGPENIPAAFHIYSMRQAIEEDFIVDVLSNYTPYSLAFRLANQGKELRNTEVDRDAAMRGVMSWVKLHPHNISQKVKIVVEHYRENVADLLEAKAKAMVVLSSRKEAVRWKIAIDKYVREQNYEIGSLVAFSGEVIDRESGPEPFTERSSTMNPDLKERDIAEAFDTPDYHILLVANKFQTGFDQPLLCAMYVDRRLAGVQSVQTLSRLNRSYPGKETTYVLDFSDSSDEVLKAFSTYHGTAELETTSDPNIIFDLCAKLDGGGHYDDFEVERVVQVELDPKSQQSHLVSAIEPVASRLLQQFNDAKKALAAAAAAGKSTAEADARDTMNALEIFKRDMLTFLRAYAFLSQIFDYQTTTVEKRAIFYRRLVPLLKFGREREEVDLSQVVMTHHSIRSRGRVRFSLAGSDDDDKLKPASEVGTGEVREKEKVLLDEIIKRMNDLFEGDLTDTDQLVYVNEVLKGKLMESETLVQQAKNNSRQQFSNSPDLNNEIMNAIIEAFEAHSTISRQAMDSDEVRAGLKDILLGPGKLWETLRDASGH